MPFPYSLTPFPYFRNSMRLPTCQHTSSTANPAQTCYCLGLQSGLLQAMADTERLALLIAALCHDLEHPVRANGRALAALQRSHPKP